MLIQETSPRLRQFTLHQTDNDPNYGSCLWMTVTFDLDKYAMMAQSDQGDYSYTWCQTPDTEGFLKLMCHIDQDYLLRKLSSPCVFNLQESKQRTLDMLDQHDVTAKLKKAIMSMDSPTEESFYHDCCDILSEYKIDHDFETVQLVKDYPHSAVVFTQLFCDHLQPYLRTMLKQEAAR